MEEMAYYFWYIIFNIKKYKNATEIKKNCSLYGEGAVTDRMC